MKTAAFILATILLLTGCSAINQNTTTSYSPETEPKFTGVPTTVPEPTETEPPDPIMVLIQSMSIEEKVGQLFLARCPDFNQIEDISTYHLGGYILFGKDFSNQTPDSIRQLLNDFQSNSKIPMLIAVDEEGGTVCRVSNNAAFRSTPFPSPRDAFSQGGLEYVWKLEDEKAALLSGLGINVNMAPVCDITTDPFSFMYQRSIGQSAEITGQFAVGTINAACNYSVGCVLKHFPGYGNNTDTHIGIATDNRAIHELQNNDLMPFQTAIDAGCDAILVSHTFINCMDPNSPATLSPAVHQYLREEMGFDGVIFTDDLVMQAITNIYGDEEAAILAVLAGNDILCATNYPSQYSAVLAAVNNGRINEGLLDNAVYRILKWKSELGLI